MPMYYLSHGSIANLIAFDHIKGLSCNFTAVGKKSFWPPLKFYSHPIYCHKIMTKCVCVWLNWLRLG